MLQKNNKDFRSNSLAPEFWVRRIEMKKIKYIVAAMLLVTATASAGTNEVTVSVNDNYVIVKGDGDMKNYTNTSPSPYTSDCDNINFVNVMNGIKKIGNNSFTDCVNIGDIIFPSSVRKIGNQAFAGCKNITEVIIPYGVTEIGRYAFLNCRNLKKVYIPDTVVKYGESCFYGCPELTIYAGEKSCMNYYAKSEGINYVVLNGEQNVQTDVLDDVEIIINGNELTYKYPVIMRNSMTFVPLRTIFEAVGCQVGWNSEEQCASVTRGSDVYKFYIGNSDIVINGEKDTLAMPTSLVCGNTMVHIRAVEKLGMTVEWDGDNKIISINY